MTRTRLGLLLLAAAAALCAAAACRKDRSRAQWQRLSETSIDLYDQGRYLEALPPAKQAAAIAEKAFGPADLRTAYALDHLGKVYRRTGELETARPLFERAVRITAEALDHDAPMRAHFLDNLAELLMAQGKYDEAEDFYGDSLHLMQRSFGELSAPVSAAYTRLATLYTRWGVYAEAEKLIARLQDINSRIGASDAAMDAAVAAALAEIYLKTGRVDQAREPCRRALSLRQRLPHNHLDLAQSLSGMGLLLLREGRLEEAQRSIQQAVDIHRSSPGADPQGLVEGWLDMAEVYAAQGRTQEAEKLFNSLLPRYDNPYAQVKAAIRVAGYYQQHGRLDTAEPLYLQALARQVASPKADQKDREVLLIRLAEVATGLGKQEQAEGYLRRALETNEDLRGELDPSSLDILASMARLQIARHRLDRAELWVARMRKVADAHGRESGIGKDALRRMAKIYRSMGRKDRAARLERQADYGS
ncbi:MAG: tetratricopeptide repeat protein [Elusimicrobia bacterium]|nr:tetratricopeptide repeat protein [Elusimicrobiota bacterium]